MRYILSFGLLWGLAESIIPWVLKAGCPGTSIGSLMAGLAFFFLAGSYFSSHRMSAPLMIAVIAAIIKLTGLTIRHAAIPTGLWLNPIGAYALQAILFRLGMQFRNRSSSLQILATGIISGGLAGLFYPTVIGMMGQSACIHPDSGIAVSVYYAPLTAAIAGPASLAGYHIGRFLYSGHQRLPQLHPLGYWLVNLIILGSSLILN
ncbi:MAG: hypothetical protein KBA26_10865 [Candidatus Delongbacteria bacterium]|nr:hypothetical protein [Candidatus Delongbacteria bacterium]